MNEPDTSPPDEPDTSESPYPAPAPESLEVPTEAAATDADTDAGDSQPREAAPVTEPCAPKSPNRTHPARPTRQMVTLCRCGC